MAEETDITHKKTLRLKKPGAETADAPVSTMAPAGVVPAVMGRSRPATAARTSNASVAIVAAIAALVFAVLVLLQALELRTYQYAFPRRPTQTLP